MKQETTAAMVSPLNLPSLSLSLPANVGSLPGSCRLCSREGTSGFSSHPQNAFAFSMFGRWYFPLEEEMATHSSVLAWEIPWTAESGGVQSTGCKESDMTEHANTKVKSF